MFSALVDPFVIQYTAIKTIYNYVIGQPHPDNKRDVKQAAEIELNADETHLHDKIVRDLHKYCKEHLHNPKELHQRCTYEISFRKSLSWSKVKRKLESLGPYLAQVDVENKKPILYLKNRSNCIQNSYEILRAAEKSRDKNQTMIKQLDPVNDKDQIEALQTRIVEITEIIIPGRRNYMSERLKECKEAILEASKNAILMDIPEVSKFIHFMITKQDQLDLFNKEGWDFIDFNDLDDEKLHVQIQKNDEERIDDLIEIDSAIRATFVIEQQMKIVALKESNFRHLQNLAQPQKKPASEVLLTDDIFYCYDFEQLPADKKKKKDGGEDEFIQRIIAKNEQEEKKKKREAKNERLKEIINLALQNINQLNQNI